MTQPQQPNQTPIPLCGDLSADTPPGFWQPDGRLCWNAEKDFQKPFWVPGNAPNNVFPLALAVNGSAVITHNVSPDGPAGGDTEFCNLYMTDSAGGAARCSVQYFDSRSKRYYMNTPVSSNMVFGVASLPDVLPMNIYVAATNSLQATIVNLEAIPVTFTITAFGRRFVDPASARMEARRRAEFFRARVQLYWLNNNLGVQTAVGAGGTAIIRMTVPGNAHFEAVHLLDDSDGDYTVEIREGESGRSYTNGIQLPRDHVFHRTLAVAGLPQGRMRAVSTAILRTCKWSYGVGPNTTLTFFITDTSGAPNNVRISVLGRLWYIDSTGDPASAPMLSLNERMASALGPFAMPGAYGSCPPLPYQGPMPGMYPGSY